MPNNRGKKKAAAATAAPAATAATADKKPAQPKNNGPNMGNYDETGHWKLTGHHKSAQELADIRNAVMSLMAATKADAPVLERLRMQAERYNASKEAFDAKHPSFDPEHMAKFHAIRKGQLEVARLQKELKEDANVPSVTVDVPKSGVEGACIGVEDGSDYSDGE